jgi:hypothetical protein
MPRKKIVGPGKPKKIAVEKPQVKHPYRVRFGTPNELGDTRYYASMPKAKAAITKELEGWKPWCKSFNMDGLDAIAAAVTEVDEMVFHETPGRIVCCFDEHSGLTFVAEYVHAP